MLQEGGKEGGWTGKREENKSRTRGERDERRVASGSPPSTDKPNHGNSEREAKEKKKVTHMCTR